MYNDFLVSSSYDGYLCVTFLPSISHPSYSFTKTKIDLFFNLMIPTEGYQVAGGSDHRITILNISNPSKKNVIPWPHQYNVMGLAYTNEHLISGSEDRKIAIRDKTGHFMIVETQSPVNAVAVHGGMVLSGTDDGVLALYTVKREKLDSVSLSDSPIRSISSSENHIVVGAQNGVVSLVSIAENRIVVERSFKAHSRYLLTVLIAPDESCFLSSAAENAVKLWGFDSDTPIMEFVDPSGDGWIWSAVFTSDSLGVCSTSTTKGWVNIWNRNTGELVRTLKDHTKTVTALAVVKQ